MRRTASSLPERQANQSGKASPKHRTFAVFARRLIILAVIASLLAAGWFALLRAGKSMVDEQELAPFLAAGAASDGHAAGHAEESLMTVRIDDMPDYVWQAFVAIEDHRFFRHPGVDIRSLARSVWVNAIANETVQGGSTITMQLARNVFLTQDKTLVRKLKEMAIALYLERTYTKEQLLTMYLNAIYFGHGQYGIEAAADYYFGKTANGHDPHKTVMRLSEAALLAGMLKAPEHYSPLKDWNRSKERQSVVLERMERLGMITEEEKLAAMQEKIELTRK